MSRVCSIHEEFCPDGECRWCEPPAAEPDRIATAMKLLEAGTMDTGTALGLMAALPTDILKAFYNQPLVHYGDCHAIKNTGVCNCAAIAASHT